MRNFIGRLSFCYGLFLLALPSALLERAARDKARDISAEIINETSVIVRWLPPRSSSIECPVTRYLIRLKTEGEIRSRSRKVGGNRHHAIFEDVKPRRTHQVRIVSVSCNGKSQPTRWVTAVASGISEQTSGRHELKTPSQPSNVKTRTFSDSIVLTWQPPLDNVLVRGYMVGYGQGVPDVNWQYVDANTREFTIRNLRPATQYVVSLRAFNNFGKGPVIYDLMYTSDDQNGESSRPLKPPIGLKSRVLSAHTVWLEWVDSSLGRVQKVTDGRYYIVSYEAVPFGEPATVTVKGLNVVLYNLKAGTTYEFRVRTRRERETTNFGISVYNKTFDAVPERAPDKLVVEALDTSDLTKVKVNWQQPTDTNGPITGYLVSYSIDPIAPDSKWQVKGTPTGASNATVEDLKPGMIYYFSVQAENKIGAGPKSPAVKYSTGSSEHRYEPARHALQIEDMMQAQGQAGDVTAPQSLRIKATPSSTSLSIHWTAPMRVRGSRKGYSLYYTTDVAMNEDTWLIETIPASMTHFNLHGLSQNTDYFFKLRAEDEQGAGPFTPIVTYHVPYQVSESATPASGDGAETVTVTAVVQHRISSVLSWQERRCGGTSRHGIYVLTYHRVGSLAKTTLETTKPIAVLEALHPESDYAYELSMIGLDDEETLWLQRGEFSTKN